MFTISFSRAETAGTEPSSEVTALDGLPQCFNKDAQFAEIKRVQRANKKNNNKYDGYKRLFTQNAVDEVEILNRLVYAEVVAAKCSSKNSEMIQPISEVILNRIRRRGGNYGSVIFQRNQFASSLNIYKLKVGASEYKEFLCPKDKPLWEEVQKVTSELRSGVKSFAQDPSTYHYYLFEHFSSDDRPSWEKSYSPETNISDAGKECLITYKNPNWE